MLRLLTHSRSCIIASAILQLAPIAAAQTPAAPVTAPPVYTPTSLAAAPDTPRTPDGRPDFQGAVWATNFFPVFETSPMTASLVVPEAEGKKMVGMMLAGFFSDPDDNLKIDPEVGDIIGGVDGFPVVRAERRTRQVVVPPTGKVPMTDKARAVIKADPPFGGGPMDNHEERPSAERCVTISGQAPFATIISYNRMRMVQTPSHIVIHSENGDEARIVPFAAKHAASAVRPLFGDGVARWEGDTLVIETVRFPDEYTVRGFSSFVVGPESKVIERYTRLSKDELLYQYTVEDPTLYSGPWLAEYSFHAASTGMFPSNCHEHNYSLPSILSGARVIEARAKK